MLSRHDRPNCTKHLTLRTCPSCCTREWRISTGEGSGLCEAPEREDGRLGATTAIRGLIEAILLEPEGEQLKITLKGRLAGMLSAARDNKRSPETGDILVQLQMVAWACSRRYLQLWGAIVRH